MLPNTSNSASSGVCEKYKKKNPKQTRNQNNSSVLYILHSNWEVPRTISASYKQLLVIFQEGHSF